MPGIRPLVLGIIWKGDSILVARGSDPVKRESFLRPLGGEIEFGERAAEALMREFREEVAAELVDLKPLGVLENLFTYNGKPCHEIVHLVEARLADRRLYELDSLPIHEAGWFETRWIDPFSALPEPLYPDGLTDALRRSPNHSG